MTEVDHSLTGAVRVWLRALGVGDGEVTRTPYRFAEALTELTSGTFTDPAEHLKTTFTADADEMIVLRRVPLVSLCEHHLMPFTGHATVGYIPAEGAGVVGVSKLARVVDGYASRLQLQERLTAQVADCIETHLDTVGVAVTITAVHSCLSLRGARKVGAELVTSVTRGAFRDQPAARAEFFALARGNGG
jgi:GTP cyclohydrolase I